MEKFYVGQKVIIKDNLPKYLTHFIGEVGIILEIWNNKAKLELNLKNYSELLVRGGKVNVDISSRLNTLSP